MHTQPSLGTCSGTCLPNHMFSLGVTFLMGALRSTFITKNSFPTA